MKMRMKTMETRRTLKSNSPRLLGAHTQCVCIFLYVLRVEYG